MVGNEDGLNLASLLERGWLSTKRVTACSCSRSTRRAWTACCTARCTSCSASRRAAAGADIPLPLVVDVDVRGLASLDDPPEPMPAPSLRG